MIDPATRGSEIKKIKDPNNSADASRIFNNTSLNRYQKPGKVIMDSWSELKREFISLLKTFGVKANHIDVKNLQANAILKRVQQVVVNMIRSTDLEIYDLVQEDS